MAFFDSRDAVFKIDDTGGTIRNLSAYITDIGGLPGPRNLNEVTALGDTGTKSIPGLEDVTISLSGIFDDTATTGPDAVFGALRTNTAAVDFEYSPKGATTGFVKYSGTCWVETYEVGASVGSRVEFSVSLKVEGAVTKGVN